MAPALALVVVAGCSKVEAPDDTAQIPATSIPKPAVAPEPAEPPVHVGSIYHILDELDRPVPPKGPAIGKIRNAEVRNLYLTLGGMPTTGTLLFPRSSPEHFASRTLVLPEKPYLSVGMTVIPAPGHSDDTAVTFRLEAEHGDSKDVLFEEKVDSSVQDNPPRWVDKLLDLGAMAGEEVRFVFSVENASENPEAPLPQFLWSDPIVFNDADRSLDPRPNVILVSLDTLRADHLGCYGYERDTSPWLDEFAASSVLFETCISPSSWTLPVHASLMTGLAPAVHGANMDMGASLPPDVPTLAEMARNDGYRTAAYTGGGWVSSRLGFGRGFERSYESIRLEQKLDASLDWLKSIHDEPFFLFLHTFRIHSPYDPPDPYASKYLDPDYDGPLGTYLDTNDRDFMQALTEADRRHAAALYDGEIAQLDHVLQGYFDKIKELGMWDNTLIVVVADHGEELWDHGQWGHGVKLYEEQVHVPLIVKAPGANPPHHRVSQMVSLIDVYATIAEYLGMPLTDTEDSRTLTGLIQSPSTEPFRSYLVSEVGLRNDAWEEIHRDPRRYMVRTPDAKYIDNGDLSPPEYYVLSEDPGEQQNRYDSASPEALDELRGYLEQTRLRHEEERVKLKDHGLITMDKSFIQDLKALGYL